jgi:hypothetical protein
MRRKSADFSRINAQLAAALAISGGAASHRALPGAAARRKKVAYGGAQFKISPYLCGMIFCL